MIVLKLLLYFVVIIGVLVLAYYATKFIGGLAGAGQSSANIRILEKVMVSRDEFLLIVKIQDTIMLLGVTPGGISRLGELDDYIESSVPAPQDFGAVLAAQIKKNLSGNGKNKKHTRYRGDE